jgi:hypothetical protein
LRLVSAWPSRKLTGGRQRASNSSERRRQRVKGCSAWPRRRRLEERRRRKLVNGCSVWLRRRRLEERRMRRPALLKRKRLERSIAPKRAVVVLKSSV